MFSFTFFIHPNPPSFYFVLPPFSAFWVSESRRRKFSPGVLRAESLATGLGSVVERGPGPGYQLSYRGFAEGTGQSQCQNGPGDLGRTGCRRRGGTGEECLSRAQEYGLQVRSSVFRLPTS